MASLAPLSPNPSSRPVVAVFGASWAAPDSALYATAIALGAALAAAGCDVISGGYGGTMEGVSIGARGGGAAAIGVLVPSLFPDRAAEGNAALTARVDAPTLLTRIDLMLTRSPRCIIALPGTLGTMAEILAAWNNAILAPLRGARGARVVAWRQPWEAVLCAAMDTLKLAQEQRDAVVFVDCVEEAVAALQAELAR